MSRPSSVALWCRLTLLPPAADQDAQSIVVAQAGTETMSGSGKLCGFFVDGVAHDVTAHPRTALGTYYLVGLRNG
jgi:hypothetical protein